MKRLYFVRHGESEANVTRTFAGQAETPLTKYGREQALIAGGAAKNLTIDRIITSPLSRAFDTATIIARTIGFPLEKIELSDLLLERSFGSLVGQSWDIDPASVQSTGVETIEQLLERARLALEFLQSLPDENILVASHGSFGWALQATIHPELRDIPEEESAGIPNATIIQFI